MGNQASSALLSSPSNASSSDDQAPSTQMALLAVRNHKAAYTQEDAIKLRNRCIKIASEARAKLSPRASPTAKPQDLSTLKLQRSQFHKAMKEVGIQQESGGDFEMLDDLFTMWDASGSDELPLALFCASAVCPLAVVSEETEAKRKAASQKSPKSSSASAVATTLQFVLRMYDVNKTKQIHYQELIHVLGGINVTASYLGDAVLTPPQVRAIATDIFQVKLRLAGHVPVINPSNPKQPEEEASEKGSGAPHDPSGTILSGSTFISMDGSEIDSFLEYDKFVKQIVLHPYALDFIQGKGTMRYGQHPAESASGSGDDESNFASARTSTPIAT